MSTPVVATSSDLVYLRLRDEGYRADDIARWASVVRDLAKDARDVFIYFKHEEEGKGPEFANMLTAELRSSQASLATP
jgi:uncharacterized protein YecE (DUF72 family)